MGAFVVVLTKLMDLAFPINNVFAVVAFTDNLILSIAGVFYRYFGFTYPQRTGVKCAIVVMR